MLADVASEKAVLAALYKYGKEQYIDICDIIQQSSTFTNRTNQLLYSCLEYIYEKYEADKADIAMIYSAAKDIGIGHILDSEKDRSHIEQILIFSVDRSNANKLAAKIRKLAIARTINESLEGIKSKIEQVSGSEKMSEIMGLVENPILDLSTLLNNSNENPVRMGDVVDQYIAEKMEAPVEQIGISTGFKKWDAAIGGGLRPGSLSIIGARMKGFKSGLALNMGKHMAKLGVPVLYMDTELQEKEQMPRMIASECGVPMHRIETGKFASSFTEKQKVSDSAKAIRAMPFYHKQISGVAFEEQIAIMKRWIYRTPGVTTSGKANRSVIIYDYIKLMESTSLSDHMREYQAIGFMVTSLHNFATKYDIPILSFVQLNRDGIDREDTGTVSQSDRILWICSNFSIFKRKNQEEMAVDGGDNFKLIPKTLRHGPGLEDDDYINVKVIGDTFSIKEGKLKSEIRTGDATTDDDDENVDF